MSSSKSSSWRSCDLVMTRMACRSCLEIEARTGRSLTVGALYRTLDRLEGKGYVTSWFSDPTPERGGRSKRYFQRATSGASDVARQPRCPGRHVGGLEPLVTRGS